MDHSVTVAEAAVIVDKLAAVDKVEIVDNKDLLFHSAENKNFDYNSNRIAVVA